MVKSPSFEDLLKRWNRGVLRGAQLRLSRTLHLDPSNIRRWMEGVYLPSEEVRPRLAKTLGVSVDALLASLRPAARPGGDPIALVLSPQEVEMLRGAAERDTRSLADELRWLVRAYAAGKLVPPPAGASYTLK